LRIDPKVIRIFIEYYEALLLHETDVGARSRIEQLLMDARFELEMAATEHLASRLRPST
jgi:hypothetical protein